jgi:hypothetical protein
MDWRVELIDEVEHEAGKITISLTSPQPRALSIVPLDQEAFHQ